MFKFEGNRAFVENPFVTSFLSTHEANTPLLRCFEDIVETLCRVMNDCMGKFSRYESGEDKTDILIRYLETYQTKSIEMEEQRQKAQAAAMEQVASTVVSRAAGLMSAIESKTTNTVEKLDPKTLLDSLSCVVRDSMIAVQEGMGKIHLETLQTSSMIKSDTVEMRKRIEDIDRRLNYRTSKEKGTDGEQRMFDLLADHPCLKSHDGFLVEDVHGQPHMGDIWITRTNYTPICVEIKNHGELTGGSVRTRETVKFYSDLETNQIHGIFVSLHSDIVGKKGVELERRSNGKFALFISKNEYNVDQIVDGITMIHYLEKQFRPYEDEEDGSFRISEEVIDTIKEHIRECESSVQETREHMNRALKSLSVISFQHILPLLFQQTDPNLASTSSTRRPRKRALSEKKHICEHCGAGFDLPSTKSMHKRDRCPVIKAMTAQSTENSIHTSTSETKRRYKVVKPVNTARVQESTTPLTIPTIDEEPSA